MSFDIVGNSSSATKAFKDTAEGAALASKAAKDLSEKLTTQSKSAQVSAAATLSLVKSDQLLADAELTLAGRLDETSFALKEQGKQADETAVKLKAAGDAAGGAGGGFGAMGGGMGAAIAAGVVLAPVIATVGLGLGGLALGALGAAKDTRAMATILGPLKSDLSQFQATLKPEVLGLFGQAASIAERGLKSLQPVAAVTGGALSGVLSEVGAELSSGQWQQFFGFMERTAAPDMALLGSVTTDLLKLLPVLLEDLQQDGTALLGTADGALKAVAGLAQLEHEVSTLGGTAQSSSGFLGEVWDGVRNATTAVFNPAANAVHILTGAVSSLDGSATQLTAPLSSVTSTTTILSSAAAQAAPKVGTLAGDMAILAQDVQSGNVQLAAFNDLADQLIGNSLSAQQAVIADSQAFDALVKSVQKTGAQSDASRAAFISFAQQVLTTTSAMVQHGASVADVNAEYKLNIERLLSLHNLSPQQRADIQGLIRDYDGWAASTIGLSGATKTAAATIEGDYIGALQGAHRLTPQVSKDISAFSDTIIKTGQSSDATKHSRDVLIADLERAGFSAKDAAGLVQGLQADIGKLHGTTVNVGVTASGHGQVDISGTGINTHVLNVATGQISAGGGHTAAAGWYVSGGTPGRDSVPVLAMPGEVIVPTGMVQGGAVDHLRGKIPGFAAGGVINGNAPAQLGGYEAAFGQVAAQAFTQKAVADAVKAFTVPAGVSLSGLGAGAGSGYAAFQQVAAKLGWGGALFQDWVNVELREAGFSLTATNPSSGAYGMAQFIQGPSEYAQYGGNATTYIGQAVAMANYIRQRYGTPAGAWAHEQAYNWYGGGLDGVFRQPTVIGVGERGPERVQVTPLNHGGGSGDVHVHVSINAPVGSEAQLETWFVNVMDSAARKGRLTYALRNSPSAG